VSFIDLLFRNQPRVIATAVLSSPEGIALVDPGPASCIATLEAGLQRFGGSWSDVTHLLLTHIHLDHAGGTGEILRRAPHLRVIVHERGAPHMIDPSRLLASATRLYGDAMDTLWGPFLPVPADSVHVVTGGEVIECAGRRLRVAYTPGHAVHHVSFFDQSRGVAYVGDVGGVRVAGEFVLAPTPPPDIDLDAWARSLDILDEWAPDELFLTHFGPTTMVKAHVARVRDALQRSATLVRETLALPGTDEEKIAVFVEQIRVDAREVLTEQDAVALELAAPFGQLWLGLARYWRKRGEAPQ
jgi:glyoxylase-like metal-dependent hydrolase (beta-lactamase superfamily II)